MLFALVGLVACLAQPVLSSPNGNHTRIVTTYSTMFCSTEYGPTRVDKPYPRTTIISVTHSHSTTTSVVTSITTITPTNATTTSTLTSTKYSTRPIVTDTYTSTITSTATETHLTTSGFTETTTSTATSTTTPTTTIAEASAFTPIQLAPAVTSAGTPSDKKRDLEGRSAPVLAINAVGLHKLPIGVKAASSYPTQVMCSRTMTYLTNTYYTSTAASTSTTTASPSTITVSTTKTVTSTTEKPDASTTETITTTSTKTTTSTIDTTTTLSTTTTATATAPTATTFAVCEDPYNYITEINGSYIDLTTATGGNAVMATSNTASAHDCCVQCQMTAGCQISFFLEYSTTCYMISKDGGCGPRKTLFNFFTTTNNTAFPHGPLNLTNTNCGQNVYKGTYE